MSGYFEFCGQVGGHFVRKSSQGWSHCQDVVWKETPLENRKPHFFSGHFGYSGHVSGNFGENKFMRPGVSIEKMLYAKKPVKIRTIPILSADILNTVAILKKKSSWVRNQCREDIVCKKSRRNTKNQTLVSVFPFLDFENKLTKTILGQRGYCVPKTASESGPG